MATYPLDLTANLAANYKEDIYTRPKEGVWMFVMDGGAFYTKDLVVRNQYDGRELTPLTQYRALHTVRDAVLDSGGKEVCAIIVITDSSVTQVSVKRRIVGGPEFSVIGSDILNVVTQAKLDALDSTAWGQIVGTPNQYPPEIHTHYDKDVYGLETAIAMMERISQSITTGDKALFGMFYQYIDRQFKQLTDSTTAELQRLQTEVNTNRTAGRFQPNEIVVFTDNSDPKVVFGYGKWERLPEGVFMFTSDNSKLGKRKKLGEGPDYNGYFYSAWRFISE